LLRKSAASRSRSQRAFPEERKENQQRAALVEMHREAQAFFVKQLETTAEGKAARAYLEDRGLNAEAIAQFGIGYTPSAGRAVALLEAKICGETAGGIGADFAGPERAAV